LRNCSSDPQRRKEEGDIIIGEASSYLGTALINYYGADANGIQYRRLKKCALHADTLR
jgi:hypothetical protein